jgi:PPOX class probable F420-dependent enzyme
MAFVDLYPEKYLLLTTFRKSGVGVPTAVWAARDGDALVVTTVASAGKVKRIRNNSEVTLQPCTVSGRVKRHAAPVTGRAEIVEDPVAFEAGNAIIAKKYGWMFRMAFFAQYGRGGDKSSRVILRLTAA